jgi:hypothetical protein
MRKYPIHDDNYDMERLAELNAETWQVDLLKINSDYPHWGNFEDNMSNNKEIGWDKPIEHNNWKEFIESFSLPNDYNECPNFYFEISRKNHTCPHCDGTNLNKATKQLSDDWYDLDHTGRKWSVDINDSEVEALVKAGRLFDFFDERYRFDDEIGSWVVLERAEKYEDSKWVPCDKPKLPTAQEVNRWAKGRGMGHDCINQWICVETRAKDLGVYGNCEHCDGGYIYDESQATVSLQLWILHPRKGASRGVYIHKIEHDDLPDIYNYLNAAKQRNDDKFARIEMLVEPNNVNN